jgi:4-diphosphocytidyl-2-C-methyl-D-erythritol kinase
LAEWGGELGSDVPFFFATPAAWGTGRGERAQPVPVGGPLTFVLACPAAGLATAEVYRGVTVPERPQSGNALRKALAQGDVEAVGRGLFNRLQGAAERLCPAVAEVYERLGRLGPAGRLMSGSGSSLFALCRSHAEALRIARDLSNGHEEEESLRVFLVHSCF